MNLDGKVSGPFAVARGPALSAIPLPGTRVRQFGRRTRR